MYIIIEKAKFDIISSKNNAIELALSEAKKNRTDFYVAELIGKASTIKQIEYKDELCYTDKILSL